MVNINFMPWRSKLLRQQRRRKWQVILFCPSICVVMLFSVHIYFNNKTQVLQFNVVSLQSELQKTNQLSPSQAPAINLLSDMQAQQLRLIKLFMHLSSSSNQKVCFTHVEKNNQHITFTGKAFSITDLTAYLKQWPGAELFSEIKIGHLNKKLYEDSIEFQFYGLESTQVGGD